MGISSPYARRGALWHAFKSHHGRDHDPVLVWKADTATMNPTVEAAIIADAYEADPVAAGSEYGAEFQTDLEAFLAREALEACIVPGRYELPAIPGVEYVAFVDPSGGSQDSMTLAIAPTGRERSGSASCSTACARCGRRPRQGQVGRRGTRRCRRRDAGDPVEKASTKASGCFESLDAAALTERRFALLRLVRQRRPASVAELARMAKRDFKAVYRDVEVLRALGLITMGERRRGVPSRPMSRATEIVLRIAV